MKSGYLSEMFVSFQGEGTHVGERHLFVRLAGCHLRCTYCDTPDSLVRTSELVVHAASGSKTYPNPITASLARDLLRSLVAAEGPIDAISLTGGEPLVQSGFLTELLGEGWPGVPTLLETSGTLPGPLTDVLPFVDIVSMDLKLPSNTGEAGFWEKQAEFLRLASEKAETYVKIPVDDSTSDADFQAALNLLDAGPRVEVFLQPIADSHGGFEVSTATLDRLQRLARSRLPRVRIIPQMHKLLGVR